MPDECDARYAGSHPWRTIHAFAERCGPQGHPTTIERSRPEGARRTFAAWASGLVAAAGVGFGAAQAQDAAHPANTFEDLRREVGGCLAHTPLATGSRVTVMFSLRRDGSLFGRPRITYAHLEGDADARARFLADARSAVDSCLPIRITPAFGGAIAGRVFSLTLGEPKPEHKI